MSPLDVENDDYLARYAASLTGFDSRAAASLWATPGMILDGQFAGVSKIATPWLTASNVLSRSKARLGLGRL